MGDKIRHLSSTSGYQNLFSAGLSMSPIVWDSALAEGSSPSRQPAFNFDDQTTSRWRQQQQPQQQVIKSKCSRKHSRSGKAPRARKQNKTITEKAEQLVNLEQSNEQEDYESKFWLEFV